jgi:hypothetical protein
MSGSFSNNLSVITTMMRHFAEPPTNKVVCSKSIYHFRPSRLKNDILLSFHSPINREFYLAKGTEKFILLRYLLSGILLILLSLRPWRVAARPTILENSGAKSHFCDYFIIRARYFYQSYYRKCRACNSLHFFFFMFFCQINSFVVTACRN